MRTRPPSGFALPSRCIADARCRIDGRTEQIGPEREGGTAEHLNLSSTVQRLGERGQRVTAPRLAGLAAAAEDQLAAEELAQRLPAVGRATVFRSVKLLVELDVFCPVLGDDGSLRYRRSGRGHHHRLVWAESGAVGDCTACDVDNLVRELSRRSRLAAEGHWLQVYGRCRACAEKVAAVLAVPAAP